MRLGLLSPLVFFVLSTADPEHQESIDSMTSFRLSPTQHLGLHLLCMLTLVGLNSPLTGKQTIGTAVFLYSPTVREQYAARHPASPEPTVRFNDLCFGINAVVFCTITVSQFWPRLWGFKHAANRHANAVTWSIVCASLLGIAASATMVLASRRHADTSVHEWEWIDVV